MFSVFPLGNNGAQSIQYLWGSCRVPSAVLEAEVQYWTKQTWPLPPPSVKTQVTGLLAQNSEAGRRMYIFKLPVNVDIPGWETKL